MPVRIFEIQTDHPIKARRPGLVLIKKRSVFVPADHRLKIKESEKINKCLNFARQSKPANCGTWRWRCY